MVSPESTILIVQNNTRDLLRLLYAFARIGHLAPIESTGDGIDAVALLEGTGNYEDRRLFPTPGLVLVDLDLDAGSGFQVLRWIQSSRLAGLPSVVLTRSRQPQDVQRAYALGAHEYRVTPSSLLDLCAIVRDLEAYWSLLQKGA